jgi:hypothetical protein
LRLLHPGFVQARIGMARAAQIRTNAAPHEDGGRAAELLYCTVSDDTQILADVSLAPPSMTRAMESATPLISTVMKAMKWRRERALIHQRSEIARERNASRRCSRNGIITRRGRAWAMAPIQHPMSSEFQNDSGRRPAH